MLSLVVLATAAAMTALATGMLHHDPHFKPNRTVIVQLFEWKFSDIARECEEFLGPRGFGGVQVSPVSENVVRKDFARPWWERYHPISYEIISRSGDKEGFEAMSRACNDAGVRIYVDVVFNHMAAPRPDGNADQGEEGEAGEEVAYSEVMEGTGGSTANATGRDYPAVAYSDEHFHRRCAIEDYTDGHQIRNCELKQLPDLDQSKEYVREKIIGFLDELVDMGAAGFRVDAAKYMWPMDVKAIALRIKDLNPEYDFPPGSRPFLIQEVIDLGEHAISKTEYTGNGVVTDSLHAVQMASFFNNRQPLSSLINWGPAMGFLLPFDSVVFIDTHYTQRGQWDQGPPAGEDEEITSPAFNEDDGQCTDESQWICEHRWPAVAGMVAFSNHVAAEGINGFQNAGPNQVAFCRGRKGFVAINNDPDADLETTMYACVQSGVYCDVVTGNLVDGECTGKRVKVDERRMALVSLAASDPHGVLAISDESRLGTDE